MKCKHALKFSKCKKCFKTGIVNISNKDKCYANGFIVIPSQSESVNVRTFTFDEFNSLLCTNIPLTGSCDGSLFQLGKCKSPKNSWCKKVDRENGFVTYLQVPQCCGGCYYFDLSASVSITASITLTTINVSGEVDILTINTSIPITVDLKLGEQLEREECIIDSTVQTNEKCFSSSIFPLIDTPISSVTLNGNDILNLSTLPISPNIYEFPAYFSNLSTSGMICLKDCHRILPILSIRKSELDKYLTILRRIYFFSQSETQVIFTVSNIQLRLANLSLSLIRLGDCEENCLCKKH